MWKALIEQNPNGKFIGLYSYDSNNGGVYSRLDSIPANDIDFVGGPNIETFVNAAMNKVHAIDKPGVLPFTFTKGESFPDCVELKSFYEISLYDQASIRMMIRDHYPSQPDE